MHLTNATVVVEMSHPVECDDVSTGLNFMLEIPEQEGTHVTAGKNSSNLVMITPETGDYLRISSAACMVNATPAFGTKSIR
jgi:hypothetical protein